MLDPFFDVQGGLLPFQHFDHSEGQVDGKPEAPAGQEGPVDDDPFIYGMSVLQMILPAGKAGGFSFRQEAQAPGHGGAGAHGGDVLAPGRLPFQRLLEAGMGQEVFHARFSARDKEHVAVVQGRFLKGTVRRDPELMGGDNLARTAAGNELGVDARPPQQVHRNDAFSFFGAVRDKRGNLAHICPSSCRA